MSSHPNKVPFEGVLTLVDVPSRGAPAGAQGRRLVLPRYVAEAALGSLIGMAVCFKDGWTGHNRQQKCGVIGESWLDGRKLHVGGWIYARDFPEAVKELESQGIPMGMSYDVVDAGVKDMRQDIWILTRVTFTGAAILAREKAAYAGTSFRLVQPAGLAIAAEDSSVIVANERECALECTICGELEGISRKAMENEATRAVLMARVARDHAECARWQNNPTRARAERQYKVRMRAEMQSAGLS